MQLVPVVYVLNFHTWTFWLLYKFMTRSMLINAKVNYNRELGVFSVRSEQNNLESLEVPVSRIPLPVSWLVDATAARYAHHFDPGVCHCFQVASPLWCLHKPCAPLKKKCVKSTEFTANAYISSQLYFASCFKMPFK